MRENETDQAVTYGVEAELERLMRCPECSSDRVHQVREKIGGGYGFFGFKAIGDMGAPKQVQCRNCGHQWLRAPMKELRQEAERRIDERYAALDGENERLRRQLAEYLSYQRDIDLQLRPDAERPDDERSDAGPSDGAAPPPAAN
jgi:DNA-directed RNA polymerase subunit RPC12/RpoP